MCLPPRPVRTSRRTRGASISTTGVEAGDALNWLVLQATISGIVSSPALSSPPASAPACQHVRVARPRSELPDAWQRALDELDSATSQPGQPWSCAGGELSLELDDSRDGATLKLVDADGRRVERHVPAADELVPTAEALLASFEPQPEPTTRPDQPAEPAPHVVRPRDAAPVGATTERAHEPRLIVAPVAGARYGTPAGTIWGSAGARVDVPLGAWSLGVWGRYAEPLAKGDTGRGAQPISEVNLGISGGRRLVTTPFELRVTLDPSVNVVSEQKPAPTPQAALAQEGQGAAVDLRVGVGLRAAFRFTDTWRGATGIEGDIGTESAGVGAYVGIEAVIR